ncbi:MULTISPECIES: ABC transporter permease [Pseudomonas]|uniref:Autoinducer 2 import system permease protein LsrD n=1 Tax=Pseudomonas putida TaxID=303 RepID=A0A7V8EA13_PSEPU|nr:MULTISPECIES: ABC transporter permease [Pseudomonas]KAF0251003.1 ABC transporter permease [Pseudomonas putida]MBL7228288.1 ABC transporter permease [Pseudomonas sp.]
MASAQINSTKTMQTSSVNEAIKDTRKSARLSRETLNTAGVFTLCILALFAAKWINPNAGSYQQVETILVLCSFLVVVAFGQGLVVLIGGLDLSIPSVITLGGILTAVWIGPEGSTLKVGAVLAVCAGVGLLNGLGVVVFKVPAFIMTLAMGIIVYSLCLGATGGAPSGASPGALTWIMSGRVVGIPVIVILTVVGAFIAFIVQSRTRFGTRLYALGSNAEAAKFAGLHTLRLTILTYGLSALLAGITGMLLVGYSNGATLRMGDPYLLPSVAAVVIGGSSISGGRGSFIGTLGGALLLTILDMIISSLGFSQGWRTVISGGIILFAILLQHEGAMDYLRSLKRKKSKL